MEENEDDVETKDSRRIEREKWDFIYQKEFENRSKENDNNDGMYDDEKFIYKPK